MVLRCTKKLLAVLGAGRVAEPGPAPDAEDWYAHLLWFDRRKCLLLTHAATLFRSSSQACARWTCAQLKSLGEPVNHLSAPRQRCP